MVKDTIDVFGIYIIKTVHTIPLYLQKTQNPLCKSVYEDLSELLKGELVYLTDKQDFFFVPDNTDNNLYVGNMASGEKMFGILQKMARYGMLSSDHMLIFDEPENHLHPEWQVKLAELLVTLLGNDVSVLLTTHSSTLISALQDFAYSKKLESKVNFYFADPNNGTIDNVDKFAEKEDIILSIYKKVINKKRTDNRNLLGDGLIINLFILSSKYTEMSMIFVLTRGRV